MASISLTDPVAGTTVTAGLHAANNAALRTAINGTLDNTNLAAGAAIKGSQLATGLTGPPGTQLDYVEVTANATSTATSAATATTAITSSAVAYDGSTAIWIEFQALQAFHSVGGSVVVFELYDGASNIASVGFSISASTANGPTVSGRRKLTPSNATHTYTVRMWSPTAGTSTMNAAAAGASNAPAYLRITKA